MDISLKILIVEDLLTDVVINRHELKRSGIIFADLVVETKEAYLEALETFKPDIILSDYALPHFNGMTALKLRNELYPSVPFILVTGSTNEEIAVECMKTGADDYLIKGNLNRLGQAIQSAIEKKVLIRKKEETEKSLQESELKYRKIFENIQDVFYQVDTEGRIIEISPSIVRYSGYTREELIGRPVVELYLNPAERDQLMNLLHVQGSAQDYDIQLKTKDGLIRWASLNIHIHFDSSGKPTGIEGSLRDITERKKAEEALKESEEKFRNLAESSPYAIMIYQDDQWVYSNPAGEKISGYTAAELFRMRFWEIVADEFKDKVIEYGKKRQRGEDVKSSYELRIIRKDGDYKWAYLTGTTTHYLGKAAGLISIVDITELKQMELELKTAMEKAMESDRLKSAFLANMSHEIRTPMNAILGFSELIGQPETDTAEQQRFSSIIRNAGNRLMHIINDLIDLSKLEAKEMKVNKTACNLHHLMQITLESSRNIELYNQKTNLELSVNLSEIQDDIEIETDPVRVQQILDNLILNAMKFTDKGTIETGIIKKNENGKEFLEFYVKDTGKGIPPEKLEMIFIRFRQIEENEFHEGAGLGLSISKALVELLGGEIKVQSEPGKGSTFSFTIPFIPVVVKQPVLSSENLDVMFDLRGKSILIAEDDDDSFMYFYILLKDSNALLQRARNGVEVMEMIRHEVPDLLLLDINMPVKTGYECLREIREKGYKVKVIVQTAYAMSDEKKRCIEAGCDVYSEKTI